VKAYTKNLPSHKLKTPCDILFANNCIDLFNWSQCCLGHILALARVSPTPAAVSIRLD
jgi:hypothetical protein